MNEKMEMFYETTLGDLVRVVSAIAALAVFISCMGLMGMATYTTETRTKEISIRKVLGSSDGQVIRLLSASFLKMIVLALLVGTPLAWLLNNQWLQMLAYRTSVDAGVISLSCGVLLLLGMITDGAYALSAGTAARWLRGRPRFLASERWISGGVYIGLGVVAAVSSGGRK